MNPFLTSNVMPKYLFFLDLGTNTTLFLTTFSFFFLKLPKNRKKNRFYFSYLPLLQYLCFHSKGQGVWGVFTLCREQS